MKLYAHGKHKGKVVTKLYLVSFEEDDVCDIIYKPDALGKFRKSVNFGIWGKIKFEDHILTKRKGDNDYSLLEAKNENWIFGKGFHETLFKLQWYLVIKNHQEKRVSDRDQMRMSVQVVELV